MATAELPADGELRLGAVALPAGRRIVCDGEPLAWVTSYPVPDPGKVWSALRDMQHQTSLIPVFVDDEPGAEAEDYFFYGPNSAAEIDAVDAASVLASGWDDPDREVEAMPPFVGRRTNEFLGLNGPGEGPNSLGDIVKAVIGLAMNPARNAELERLNRLDREEEGWPPPPSSSGPPAAERPFPGLAPAVSERLSTAALGALLGSLPPDRVGLVPAGRSADVLAWTGWSTFGENHDQPNGVWIGAVLRSWEERFGAHLLKVGPSAEIRLLVERPPRTPEAARQVASEHWAFAQEFHEEGQMPFSELANILVDLPLWQFWWD